LTERRAGGRPTKEGAATLDKLLLDGAREAFGRKGVVNTSIEEIAALLGVSKHTIYRRYKNKIALLDAIVSRDIQDFKTQLIAARNSGTGPLDAIRRTAFRYVEIGCSRGYAALYLSIYAEAVVSQELRHLLSGWSQQSLEPLLEALIAAREAGALRVADLMSVCCILVDLLEGATNRVRLHDGGSGVTPHPSDLFEERWSIFAIAFENVQPVKSG
jgi:AcrR family transcriptional regulator